ncbi:glycosyltransferase family protein [Kordiimonas sp.]|uniref:glycosyltransferase family protein n=1 Tax=Kordiimonas sp. TaxID=1970157 RepID=UPI003A8CDC6A
MPSRGAQVNRPVNLVYCSFVSNWLDVRSTLPIQALRMRGANVRRLSNEIRFMPKIHDDAPRIILLQRCLNDPEAWPGVIKEAVLRDWLVVVERDDYPLTPVKSSRAKWADSMQWDIFSACHAVQTTTPQLRDLFLNYNSEVAVFPNHYGEMPKYRIGDKSKVRIFFGAFNRGEAWRPLLDVFNRVFRRHPNVAPVVIADQEFYDAIDVPKKTFLKSCSYSEYLEHMSLCDIALLPLHDDIFTRHKSDVKFVEAGGTRNAVIASPTVYQDSIEHGKTGLIARSEGEWEQALERLITDKAYREKLADNAYHYVLENRMLIDRIHEWVDWYYDLWDRRKKLTEAMLERYPAGRP